MERQRYEEENFTRLPMTKEQKKLEKAARQRHARFDILGDLESKHEQPIPILLWAYYCFVDFGDLDKLMEQAEQGDLAGSLVDEEREKAKKKLLKHTVNEIETAERGRMQKILNAGGDMVRVFVWDPSPLAASIVVLTTGFAAQRRQHTPCQLLSQGRGRIIR